MAVTVFMVIWQCMWHEKAVPFLSTSLLITGARMHHSCLSGPSSLKPTYREHNLNVAIMAYALSRYTGDSYIRK
jgi:hypothetical protein